MSKKNPFKNNKNEIKYHIINSLLAGCIFLFGALSDGDITLRGVFFAFVVSAGVCVVKFKEYWEGQKREYSVKIINFI